MTRTVTVQAQQKWDYDFQSRRTEGSLLATLNELGQQGWELVNVVNYKDIKGLMAWGAFLKRPSCGQAVKPGEDSAIASSSQSARAAPVVEGAAPLQGFNLAGNEFALKSP